MTTEATPTLAHVLRTALDRELDEMYTAFPGKVLSYDAAEQVCEIEPQIKAVYRDPNGSRLTEPLPILPNVPVAFPRGGGFAVTFPIAAGDFVLVVCNKFSIDRWRETGNASDPGDLRRFGLSGAVAIPGIYPNADKLADAADANDMIMGEDGGSQIRIKTSGIIELAGSTSFVALSQKVDSELSALKTLVQAAADFSAFKASISSWPSGSTAASKVKAA